MASDIRVRFLHPSGAIGPGKIALLEAIDRTGSISAAARALGMTFRRAWFLVETMNSAFRDPVVKTSVGGREGGGGEYAPQVGFGWTNGALLALLADGLI